MPTNYDPAKLIQVLAGIPITGYADGTFVTVVRNEDSFTLRVGATGEACRARSNNKSARITFTLLQSSATNDLLSGLSNLDEMSPGGDGIGPYSLNDLFGSTKLIAEKAWIVKPADVTYSQDVETREWTIETDSLTGNVGGNI